MFFDSFNKIGLKWWQLFQDEKKLVDLYNELIKDDSHNISNILNSIQSSIEHLSETLKVKEIKSGLIFKEISDIQKGMIRLSNQLSDEELKTKAKDPVFARIIKIKEKLFDKKQERNDFVVGNYFVLHHLVLLKMVYDYQLYT